MCVIVLIGQVNFESDSFGVSDMLKNHKKKKEISVKKNGQ